MILNLHQHDLQKKPENFVVDKSFLLVFVAHIIYSLIKVCAWYIGIAASPQNIFMVATFAQHTTFCCEKGPRN